MEPGEMNTDDGLFHWQAAAAWDGKRCPWCEEEIHPNDSGVATLMHVDATGSRRVAWHPECYLRTVVGSLAHQKRTCACFGGTEWDGDGPGTTKREAAREAVEYYYEHEGRKDG